MRIILSRPRSVATLSMRSGFTLIELSVGLVILSILAAGALTVGSVVVQQQQLTSSKQRVEDAKKALTDYFIVNGRLPCPASRTLSSTNSSFGVEVNCAASGAAPAGTARVNSGGGFTGAAYTAGVARIGALPVRTLGLSDSAMSDEYGNRLIYVMTERFADSSNIDTAQGAITVQDSGGNDIATGATNNGVVFLVFSTGSDGKGGSRYTTGAATPTTCSGGLDAENCDDDIVFRDTRFNNGTGAASFYDDLMAWAPKYLLTTTAYALKAAGADKQVQFNSGGDLGGAANFYWDAVNNRVGVGTSTPTRDLDITATRDGVAGLFVSNASAGANATASTTLSLSAAAYATHQVARSGSTLYYQLNTGTGIQKTYFDVAPDFSFRDNATTPDERMVLLSSGSTTTANSTLTLNGTLRLASKPSAAAYTRSSNSIGFLAPGGMTTSTTYTLPSADGTNGQALTTNGTGTLYWRTPDVPLWQCANTANDSAFASMCFRISDGLRCTNNQSTTSWSCSTLPGWPGDGDWRCSVDMNSAFVFASCIRITDGMRCYTNQLSSSWNCSAMSGWTGP